MEDLRQKYKKISSVAGAGIKKALVLSRKKFEDLINTKETALKNFLTVLVLIFAPVFLFMVIVSIDRIEKELLSIRPVEITDHTDHELEREIKKLTAGYPIENMSRFIAREDREVAAFIVSIAKKESNWGLRTPKLDGKECYNYWGFREQRDRMGSGGHTCFDSPKDAVRSIAKRIEDLRNKDINTPEEMIVWKCGYSCESHSPQSVQKWINDVKFYYNKI